jgi:hypothetical protein
MPRSSAWFLAKFLAAAAVLFWVWSQMGGAEVYGRAVLAGVELVAPLLTGYLLDVAPSGAVFVAGESRLALPLNLRETCAGVVPFFALLLASSGRSLASRLRAAAIGVAVMFPIQVFVVAMTPWMMTRHAEWVSNLLDVVYTFAALGGLVALPLFLWWVWWKLTLPPPAPARRSST